MARSRWWLLAGLALGAGCVGPAQPGPRPAGGVLAAPHAGELDAKGFGCAGDGVADDTACVQSAVTAAEAAGAWLLFPRGTYAVSAQIRIGGAFRVRGEGATLVTAHPSGCIFTARSDLAHFTLRDLTLASSRDDLARRGTSLVYLDGVNVDGGLVENVAFSAPRSLQGGFLVAAQTARWVRDVTLRGNTFEVNTGVEVIHHTEATQAITGIVIDRNVFRHPGGVDDQYAGYAISLSGNHRGIRVTGNDIRGHPYAGIEVVARSSFVADYEISGNTVVGTGRGIIFDAGGDDSRRISRVTVAGNRIAESTYFQRFGNLADSVIRANTIDGIFPSASATRRADFAAFRSSDRLIVDGNTIRLDMPASEHAKAITEFVDVTASKITANRFGSSGFIGLWVKGRSAGNVFTGNTVGWAPKGDAYGPIFLDGAGTTRNAFDATVIWSPSSLADFVSARGAGGNSVRGTERHRAAGPR